MTINTQKNCLLHVNWLKDRYFTFFFNLQVFDERSSASVQRLPRSVKDGFGQPTLPCFLWSPKVSKFLPLFPPILKTCHFFLIIVFKKCVWDLNWPFRNVWAFTSRVTFWSVNCYYHKNRQQWFILQKEPIYAVKTVALFPLGVIWSHSVYYEPG